MGPKLDVAFQLLSSAMNERERKKVSNSSGTIASTGSAAADTAQYPVRPHHCQSTLLTWGL